MLHRGVSVIDFHLICIDLARSVIFSGQFTVFTMNMVRKCRNINSTNVVQPTIPFLPSAYETQKCYLQTQDGIQLRYTTGKCSKGWPKTYPGYCLHLWNPPLQPLHHSLQSHRIWDNYNQLVSQPCGGCYSGWIIELTTGLGHQSIVVVWYAVALRRMMKWLQWKIS